MPLMMKRLTFTGSTLRARAPADKARLAQQLRSQVWPLLEQGRLLPRIHAVFPLEQAGAAHALMESSEHIGKIVLEVRRG
jgi:NADPH:quinone reductase-like Zn-dependent oxidoreductase